MRLRVYDNTSMAVIEGYGIHKVLLCLQCTAHRQSALRKGTIDSGRRRVGEVCLQTIGT